jgi:ubiquinone/menaquinone biosynthesis C-methylase UbiE
VKRVRAVDPSAVPRKLAAERAAASTVPVEYIGANAQALPLTDASVDHVVSVLTLCTIPAADRALAEIRRVLRPGGAFHFMEHDPVTQETAARWQHRLTRSSAASSEARLGAPELVGEHDMRAPFSRQRRRAAGESGPSPGNAGRFRLPPSH